MIDYIVHIILFLILDQNDREGQEQRPIRNHAGRQSAAVIVLFLESDGTVYLGYVQIGMAPEGLESVKHCFVLRHSFLSINNKYSRNGLDPRPGS
jgi:hypothetical protein